SAVVRRSSQWVTANEAERIARITGTRIWELAHNGQLDAIFLNVRRGGIRTECWIRREPLNQWIAARDAELAPYMPRPEAQDALGLTNRTSVTVATGGVIRYVKGHQRNFPAGCFFFLREDVMTIKDAFEKHSVPARAYSRPGELIALRHAMKNYLGHGPALAAVISAVVDGRLEPAGYTNRFPGITGYLFRADELRKDRSAPNVTASPEGFLGFKEAAALLKIRPNVIRGLTDQGLLTASSGFRNGFARLIPAREVQQFAASYVATSVLAKRFNLNGGALVRYLRESGAPLLVIPIPDAGKGHASFLQKDVAAQIQLPSCEMLREAAQHRIVAARKKQWADYRQAREAALGKPMRRVRANCRVSGMAGKDTREIGL
ncbi:MAG: helix-turn-helix domain-containing protein, partial [Bryobacteraceae bacterium]